MQTTTPPLLHAAREALAAARARLFSAASRALARDTLPPEQVVRVRRALKAGRSMRCSETAIRYATRQCDLLARQLERTVDARQRRDRLPTRSGDVGRVPR
jgi:hypothetical protein